MSQVSRIVVVARFNLPAATGQRLAVAQVTAHPRLTLNDWIGALEIFGYTAPLMPYRDWSAKVKEYVDDDTKHEEHALLPLFHVVVGDLPGDSIAPELDDSNTAASIKLYQVETEKNGEVLASNVISVQTLGMYLVYMVAVGFLPPSEGDNGKESLPKLSGDMPALDHFAGRSAKP